MGATLLLSLLSAAVLSASLSNATDDPMTTANHEAPVDPVAPSCPERQEAFDGSCYEFVRLKRTFLSAQSWCERGGGHLPFVLNDETQQFLQKHLDPGLDWWLGLAPASQNLTLDPAAPEGPLSWLDGSDVSYANWVRDPLDGAGCGLILRDSGFQWEATDNCSQELDFICEFESGHALACADYNATLQCGSGQVVQIDDGFYGRKTVHYCQASRGTSPSAAQEECSWVDVVDLVKGHCHGLQACQVALDVASLGEPCPGLGSYLSVEYHCKDGLRLLMSKLAAVFDNVTITVKWLLHPFQGNLTCTLSAGDGHTVDPYSPEKSESSMVHKYTRPGIFTVGVECTTSEWHVTAQKTITIQEPIGEFGVIRCYGLNQSGDSTNCKALYGSTLNIQVEVDAGTNITYKVQSGQTVLATATAVRGIHPENITVDQDAQLQLGPGCHQLTLLASNEVTAVDVSTEILACFLEPVGGLEAWLLSSGDELCTGSELRVNVSLARGSPARLLFRISNGNSSVYETREMMNSSLQEFGVPADAQADRLVDIYMKYFPTATFQVSVRAANDLSEMDLDVGSITMVCNSSQTNETNEHSRVPRDDSNVNIELSPKNPVIGDSVTLQVKDLPKSSSDYNFAWNCSGGCKDGCPTGNLEKLKIPSDCMPDTFDVAKYTVEASLKNGGSGPERASQCIIVKPKEDLKISISCSACNPVNANQNINLQLTCEGCQTIKWYIVDINNVEDGLKRCYDSKMPGKLIPRSTGTSSLELSSSELKAAENQKANIKVVVLGIANGKSGSDTYTIDQNQPSTSPPSSGFTCSIDPSKGTILTPFTVNCSMPMPSCSSPCTFCLSAGKGKHLDCGNVPAMTSLFLPLGDKKKDYRLTLSATVENKAGFSESYSLTTQVTDTSSGSNVQDLQTQVSEQVSKLQQQGKLSGTVLANMYQSVSAKLNEGTGGEKEKSTRMEMREEMLANMSAVLQSDPSGDGLDVLATAVALEGLTHLSDELTASAQIQASTLLCNLSLILMSVNSSNTEEADLVKEAAGPIIMTASNILTSSSSSSNKREISGVLLNTIDHVQSALLDGTSTGEEPIVYSSPEITVYVNRMEPDQLQSQAVKVQNSTTASFTFPPMQEDLVSGEPVDVRMMSFATNPFSWHEEEPISGTVGSLSLTRNDGSVIPVANLTKEIEIFLPRPDGQQVNSTVLDLRNFSTVAINMTTPNISLVVRLDPSEDITLRLLLGFQYYPKDAHYEAQTQLPHPDVPPEEQYTWVLGPQELAAGVGEYFILVRPVVSAGVNSTNARVSVTSIAAQCKYWDEAEAGWNNHGCRVGPLTNASATQCLCNHLTFFGSSFFVMPNKVDVSRTAELFATFANNPVVVCFVGSLFLAYLIVVVWARRKDIADTAKLKVTMLQDNDPLAQYRYMLHVSTGHRRGASTSAQVTVTLLGSEGESEPHHLTDTDKPVFGRGDTDMFLLTTPFSLGELQSIRLWHDNSGSHPAWYVDKVMVHDLETGQKWFFLCSSWLAIDMGDFLLDKVFPVATEMDMKRFSNLFFMKTAKDFRDGHIWFSVVSRPPNSNFTRVQRVSCCFSLLLCTMLTSIMFYGVPTDPSEQKMDLGQIEFTWQQVMIGIQSSIIMFPINLFIVSIFRNTRPRERKPKQPKSESGKQGKTGRVSPSQPPSPQTGHRDITPDAIIKDIKRIAQSLSKTMKSPIPKLETEFSRTADINDLLSLVEGIIRQHNRAGEEFYSDSSKKDGALVLTLGAVNLQESSPGERPDSATGNGQRRSDYSQYLHRQLLHVEKELELLGPARFPEPHSHARAVQQVQHMKGLLKSHLSSSGSSSEDQPEGGGTSGGKCCKGGLPWWFVFVGWLLVAATSVVSAYFTMIYGLTYGLQRSISWLISMVVSFFESIFITQPLKVLGFAVFFALVLKKVDQEEYGDAPVEGALVNSDDPDAVLSARRDSTCSFYQPPPPTDIEKMRSNMIKEQKVFALFREIITYLGFLWMLLLIAYGQRDPNAYFLTQHIQQSFSNGIPDTMSQKDVFTWANTTLLSNLFGEYPGFETTGTV
ncbi:polycystin-1-like protein 2 [Anguilla rostrata]|uniref:polycystin-1-like protein 2 n=1 Tax=Anguilla rostrata TaxID=7938 RepID=UPI0030D04FDD